MCIQQRSLVGGALSPRLTIEIAPVAATLGTALASLLRHDAPLVERYLALEAPVDLVPEIVPYGLVSR